MNLTHIRTARLYEKSTSWQLVYEWEDAYKKAFDLPFSFENRLIRAIGNRFPIINKFAFGRKQILVHIMMAPAHTNYYNSKHIIPLIIDYTLSLEQIAGFERAFNQCPFILISSREVYDLLIAHGFKNRVFHLPLSLSDRYFPDEQMLNMKKYDIILMGRQNPMLEKYLNEYAGKHNDFTYVQRVKRDKQFFYYSSTGECLGEINDRIAYMELMKQGRIGLYSTPGLDNDRAMNGLSHVTPRFLELIASGCHILAKYPDNPDTKYFELDKFSPNITSYEIFERQMDIARSTIIDIKFYQEYLKKHYISNRISELKKILKKY